MWIFTNRNLQPGSTPAAFLTTFLPGAPTLAAAAVARDGSSFALAQATPGISDDDAMQRLVPVFGGARPVLVYLHGNNNAPATCFERCARLGELYDVEVIGFSWPSEGLLSSGTELPNMPALAGAKDAGDGAGDENSLGAVRAGNRKDSGVERKLRRYRQAKLNAQESGDALARFLRLVAAARLYANGQRLTVAAHSLGCHFLQYAIEAEGAAESLGAAHNIALLAACCRASGHAGWVGKLSPKGQVFVTYNQGDSVLFGAAIADGNQTKLGTEPGPRLVSPKVRYVSFTNAQAGFGGHGYFVREQGDKPPKDARKLFQRIFSSERDIRDEQNEPAKKVYPLGCDADGSTCYMAKPTNDA